MDENIFREYDIRGIVGPQLTDDIVKTLAGAVATFFARNGARRIAIGYDARESSPRYCGFLAEGLKAAGCDAVLIGMVPTPVLYHTVFTRPVDGGVMITGSHNPADHNGFKICLGKQTLFGSQIQEIKRIALAGDLVVGSGSESSLDVLQTYCDDIVSKVRLGSRKLKVVVDAGNGMGGVTAVPVYQALGVDLVSIFADPDSNFPDPTVTENLLDTIRTVEESHADVGIAFDGDADRIGIVDEKGRIIWGDELMVLLSRSILAERPGATIIAEVKCSQNLFDDIEKHGGIPVMWKAGHSLIKSKMKETGAALAGEMSGHIFFADRYYGYDDATYAGARVLEILSSTDKPLSELLADLPPSFSTPELRVPCSDNTKFQIVEKVAALYSKTNKVITIDGARIIFDHGWGLVRASNTQAILVLRFEADSQKHLDEIQQQVEATVSELIQG
jgi:phosphomannomutase / phosphoglucomutase